MSLEDESLNIIDDVEIDNFRFNASAEIKKLKDGYEITSADLDSIYSLCDGDFSSKTIALQDSNGPLKYYFFAFEKKPAKPTFCEEAVFEETKTGYFLIVYSNQYAAIFRQNFSKLGTFGNNLVDIDYQDFIDSDVNKETEFKYLNMKNLDGADYAIRKKTYEGNDLKKSISALSSSKYYVQSMRGENKGSEKDGKKGKKFSINFATSRLNHYSPRQKMVDILKWVDKSFSDLKSNKHSDATFLENFATRSKLSPDAGFEPSSLLVSMEFIYSILEDENARIMKDDQDYRSQIDKDLVCFDKTIYVNKVDEKYFARADGFDIKISFVGSRIKLGCPQWKKIVVSESTNDMYNGDLESIVNNLKLFSVYFRNETKVYTNGYLFEDTRLLKDVDWLLKYIHVDDVDVSKCKFEKVKEKMSSEKKLKTNSWPVDSEFYVIEEYFKTQYSTVICDDFQNEWADYIGIRSNQIEFCACKYKPLKEKRTRKKATEEDDGSSSASNFQDVVGQAIKNLGNFSPSSTQLDEKEKLWGEKYLKSKTLERTRFGVLKDGLDIWRSKLSDPHFTKVCSLMVNFLSKEGLKKTFEKMQKEEKVSHSESAYQQLWILSNFVHSCLEMGIEPRIYCRT